MRFYVYTVRICYKLYILLESVISYISYISYIYIHVYTYIYILYYIVLYTVTIRSNTSVCPRLRRRHVRAAKNTVFCGVKCTCPWSWLSSCNAQLSYLCVECYNNIVIIIITIIIIIIISIITIIIIIIKPLLKIFNECRSLTGWEN